MCYYTLRGGGGGGGGGLGGLASPRKISEFRSSEIDSDTI